MVKFIYIKSPDEWATTKQACRDELKKCSCKFDCLVYEMFLIREHKPCLNIQTDSIKAKLFT